MSNFKIILDATLSHFLVVLVQTLISSFKFTARVSVCVCKGSVWCCKDINASLEFAFNPNALQTLGRQTSLQLEHH